MTLDRPTPTPPRSAAVGVPDPARPRPPRRPWRPSVSIAAFALAAGLGVVAHVGTPVVIVLALVVPMVMLAFGWVPLLRLPSPRGTTGVQLVTVALLLLPSAIAPRATFDVLPGALALALVVTFVHQLARRDGRPRLVESLSASAAGVALLASAVCIVPLVAHAVGRDAVTAIMAAVAAATLTDVGLGRVPRGIIAVSCAVGSLVLGAVAASVVHAATGSTDLPGVAVAGALAGGSSYALRQIQSVLPSLWGRRAQMASAAGSVLCTGALALALVWSAHLR